jgi:hypothetical protein
VEEDGNVAIRAASEYGQVYRERRGAMVFDVVVSRQRRYDSRVLRAVEKWEANAGEPTLAWLASNIPVASDYGLRKGEPETMHSVARNLLQLAGDLDIEEDDVCRIWADRVEGLEHAPKLDPVVGAVKGIGTALFAYMRMRSGGDALKPDVRVTKGLRKLGFTVPRDGHAVLILARAVAAELGITLLTLDQLLWALEDD